MPRFLVVDHSPIVVDALSRLLRDDGHDVAEYTSASEAVQALRRESFDAVMASFDAPPRGEHDVVRAAREHQPHACLVAATTRPQETSKHLVERGVCIIADKPVEYDAITREVGACRARGGPGLHGRCHMRARPAGEQLIPLRRK